MKTSRYLFLAGMVLLLAGWVVPGGKNGDREGSKQGRLIKKIAPEYPLVAKTAKIQGLVVLKIKIDTAGKVETVEIVSGHEKLAPAAVTAVKQWRYEPFRVNGKKTAVEKTVTIQFTLTDEEEKVILPRTGLCPLR